MDSWKRLHPHRITSISNHRVAAVLGLGIPHNHHVSPWLGGKHCVCHSSLSMCASHGWFPFSYKWCIMIYLILSHEKISVSPTMREIYITITITVSTTMRCSINTHHISTTQNPLGSGREYHWVRSWSKGPGRYQALHDPTPGVPMWRVSLLKWWKWRTNLCCVRQDCYLASCHQYYLTIQEITLPQEEHFANKDRY